MKSLNSSVLFVCFYFNVQKAVQILIYINALSKQEGEVNCNRQFNSLGKNMVLLNLFAVVLLALKDPGV